MTFQGIDENHQHSGGDDGNSNINPSNLDIGGNNLIQSGDFFPLVTIHDGSETGSTTSNSYGPVLQAEIRQQWSAFTDILPSGATFGLYASAVPTPNGDQVDFRVFDAFQSVTLGEVTNATSTPETFGPAEPTGNIDTSSKSVIRFDIKNSDNETSVSVSDVLIVYGLIV